MFYGKLRAYTYGTYLLDHLEVMALRILKMT